MVPLPAFHEVGLTPVEEVEGVEDVAVAEDQEVDEGEEPAVPEYLLTMTVKRNFGRRRSFPH